MIDSLETTDTEKRRLYKEANIKDAEYIKVDESDEEL